jgi:hypothetical protein
MLSDPDLVCCRCVNDRFGSQAVARQFITWAAGNGCDINWSMQHIEQSVRPVFDILTSF